MPKKRQNRIGTVINTSGITSLSPRVYLRNTDSASGSYPTISRTGDSRTGIYSSSFDDTSAIYAGPAENMILGRQILSSSQYIGDFTATPSTNPSLTGPSTGSFGISDQRIQVRKSGQDITPFTEHRIFACDPSAIADPFYLTGSKVEDLGLSFKLPLKEKTKIEIDLNPREETKLFFSTGSATSVVNSGIAYYNFDLDRFEVHGDLTTGSNVDYFNPDPVMRSGSMLAFAPSFPNSNALIQRNSGFPTTLSGFPFDKKFNATGSQLFKASDISTPFLIEKMVYEFSGSMPFILTDVTRANIMQFFMMNQRGYNIAERNIRTSWRNTRSFIAAYGGSTVTGSFFVNNIKDIVNVAQVSLYDATSLAAGLETLGLLRDLNVQVNSIAASPTGSFVLSSSIKTPSINTGLGFLAARNIANSDGVCLIKNEFGGRTSLANHPNGILSSPRSYINNVSGRNLSGTFTSTSFDYITAELAEENDLASPYLLMPSDNLVFGWANQQQPTFNSTSNSELKIAGGGGQAGSSEDGRFNILPGKGKLVLYGSLIREDKEFHQGLNQLLTSDAVHEDVRDNTTLTNTSDCLDQFSVDYTKAYTGSYIDNIFDPDLGIGETRISSDFSSVVNGTAGTTGSILRGVHLIDQKERFYDSLTPDILRIFSIDNAQIPFDEESSTAVLAFGTGSFTAGSSTADQANHRWLKAFPFESRYDGIPRTLSTIRKAPSTRKEAGVSVVFTDYTDGDGVGMWANALEQPSSVLPADLRDRNRIIFGFGDGIKTGIPGTVDATGIDASSFGDKVSLFTGPIYRGFKYGLLNAIPQFTRAVFRHDRYGQFRDMLEQRLFGKFESSGDESREVISTIFSQVFNVGDGNLVRRQFKPTDSTGHLNIDVHSRVTKPFFDVEPTNTTKNTDVDSLQVANINSLAGGADIDPKNLGLNNFSSFIKG